MDPQILLPLSEMVSGYQAADQTQPDHGRALAERFATLSLSANELSPQLGICVEADRRDEMHRGVSNDGDIAIGLQFAQASLSYPRGTVR